MKQTTRRDFLQTTAGLAVALTGTSFVLKRSKTLLSFSTLGCPDWKFPDIVKFAAANDYSGLEIRGILRQMDLSKCPEFSTPENMKATKKLMDDNGLKWVGLGSSANLHQFDPAERKKQLDEAKRFIDLAHQLKCPYIRVFPNNFPKGHEHSETIEVIASALKELGDYAKNTSVTVLMETHGDLVQSADIEKIMQLTSHPRVALIWDVVNMWSVTKEPVATVYQKLKKYIHHTHLKDGVFKDGKLNYTLLGKGETPVFEAIDLLAKNGYTGYYSFEWEKMWHPEIAEPEIALAAYPKAMEQHFSVKG